jgi:hypothetical protein
MIYRNTPGKERPMIQRDAPIILRVSQDLILRTGFNPVPHVLILRHTATRLVTGFNPAPHVLIISIPSRNSG